MKYHIKKLIVVCATALATLSVGTDSCDAGPILDWLFPRRAARRAARAGTVTYRIPVSAYPNQLSSNQQCASRQCSGYAPRTSYRTVWTPVPVTQYRPVSYVNPLSTNGVSALRPCTTYQWQARRVPYISYQPGAQASTYPIATSSSATSVTPWTSSPSSSCCNTSNYGAMGSRAASVATEWTPVGSGVSYAAPGTTGSTSGTVPSTVSAGYSDGQVFSPSSSLVQQNYQAPQTSAAAPRCQNCPATAPASSLEPSPAGAPPNQATPWVPLEGDGRTRITPLPADTSPSLSDSVQPSELGSDEANSGDQGQDYQEPPPVSPSENGSGSRGTGYYNPPQYYGANSVRPTTSRDDVYRKQVRDESLEKKDKFRDQDTFQGDPYRAAAPSRTPTVPYLKPIPDIKRQQRSGWDANSTPGQLDDSADRTAQREAAAPHSNAVPINWSQVDIDRQDSIKRVPMRLRPIAQQQAGRPQIDDEDEGGWRRARR